MQNTAQLFRVSHSASYVTKLNENLLVIWRIANKTGRWYCHMVREHFAMATLTCAKDSKMLYNK